MPSSISGIFFWSFDLFFHLGHIFFFLISSCLLVVRGRALGICQGEAAHVAKLWCCMWRRGPKGNNATCWAFDQLSVTSSTSHKQIGLSWCWFPGGWVCVHPRTLWVSPTNSPVRLGVPPTTTTSTDFCSQRFWGFISLHWNPGLHGLSHSPVVPPGLSQHKRSGTARFMSCCLAASPLCLAAHLCPSYWSGWMFLL